MKTIMFILTICLLNVANFARAQSTNTLLLSVPQLIDAVNAIIPTNNDTVDSRSAHDLGWEQKEYPCKEVDVGTNGDGLLVTAIMQSNRLSLCYEIRDGRGICVTTIDSQTNLVFVRITPSDEWMCRVSENGRMVKAIYGLAHKGSWDDVTKENRGPSLLDLEIKFWSDWFAAPPLVSK